MNKTITLVFDLDETVINSSHRTPNEPDGTLRLAGYIAMHTPENVAKDTLLPLAKVMQGAIKAGYGVAILTARDMHECDYEYLRKHGIHTTHIFSRDRARPEHYAMRDGEYKVEWLRLMPPGVRSSHIIMFDDAKPVKAALRRAGVVCLCAHKINKKLYKQAKSL